MMTKEQKTNISPTTEEMLSMYERMLLIRLVEERLIVERAAGKLPGGVHLYIGQEAVAVGCCWALQERDRITSTHRGHGHFLAKGGSPTAMFAEIMGKRSGICHGMGGSMHVADVSKGILGANGIVGAGFAIAAGAALAAQLEDEGRVVAVFFGDGAANQGVFMETLNISTVWNLPMIFVCENNLYAEFTPSSTVTAGKLVDRAHAVNMPAQVVDGNVVEDVWRATSEAVSRARAGGGPSYIEAKTYRYRGHMEAERDILGGGTYRTDDEISERQKYDPILALKERLISRSLASEASLQKLQQRIAEQIEQATALADAAEAADERAPFDLMFADHAA